MKREDIIRMAREANFYDSEIGNNEDGFVHFAALVAAAKEAELNDGLTIAYMDGYEKGKDAGAAAEREAILPMLKGIDCTETEDPDGWWETSAGAEFGAGILAAIRARGQA